MLSTVRDVDAYFLGNVSGGSLPLQVGTDILGAYGAAEAVQRFVVRLFTKRGSIATDPERGTDLMQQLSSGKIRTEAALSMAFNAAAHDVLLALAAESGADGDADELPVEASLTNVELLPDSVSFSVSLRTAAGRLTSFELPVSV